MQSPDRDVNLRAAAALRSNPAPVAGLAAFDDRDGDLDCALETLRMAALQRQWDLREAGLTLYAMLRVAQQEYGGGDPGYWPHLAARLGVGSLGVDRQQLLGGWFRDALRYFGYPFDVSGQAHLGPILWHAGWARNQLRAFLGFVAAQVEVYGDRAAEPDAPHALRIGPIAAGWSPSLPRTIVRLLTENAGGVGDLWARLAQGVLLARRGPSAVRAAWEPIGGIGAEDIIDALRTQPPYSAVAINYPTRPRLRYDPDSGEIRLWLVEGEPSDWGVGGLNLRWQGPSAVVLPPLPAEFTLEHRRTGTTWDESLFVGESRTVWFGGRSGGLERGEAVATQGLAAGFWYVICRGVPDGLTAAARRPLAIGFYVGGERWSAWEVSVPERSEREGRLFFDVRLDGRSQQFPLARGPLPLVVAQPQLAAGELPDGTRVALYPDSPRVELRRGAAVRLIRRSDGEGAPVADWVADGEARALPNGGPSVYQLRESRGVGRVLLDYAVIPGLGAPAVFVTSGVARLTFPAASGGRIDGGVAVPGGWRVERPDVEPWLEAVWRSDRAGELPIRLRVPVRAVRWQLVDANGPLSAWGREPHPVSRREAASRRLRLRFEVPTTDLSLNDNPPADELVEGPTGWVFSTPLDALASVDAVRLRVEGHDHVAAWLTDRPVLRRFEATANVSSVAVRWEAEYLPAAVTLAVWDPTEPGGREVLLPVPQEMRARGGTFSVPPGASGFRRLSVALGATAGQGFGPARFLPATAAGDGSPVAALACRAGEPADPWGDLTHGWTVWHRWGGPAPAVGVGLGTLGSDPPLGGILDYAACLPAACPLRSGLAAILARCPDRAAEHVAVAGDPGTALRGWLALGIHPGWAPAHTTPKPKDAAYPLHYLAALRLLDAAQIPMADRCEAASDVYQFHKAHDLFSPLAGLPGAGAAARSVPLAVRGRTGNAAHAHCLTFPRVVDDADQFVAQTTGHNAYWHMPAAADDPFPRTARGGRGVVQYVRTEYAVGWDDGGLWCVERPNGAARTCCTTTDPITAPPWEPAALAAHLRLVGWLLTRSAGLSAPAPEAVLPPEFDEVLFRGPLGAVHRRVLTPPLTVEHALNGGRFMVVGAGVIRRPEYDDTPPAGKIAWRLAWLDRSRPDERAAVTDWSPYFAALRGALAHQAPGWADLLAECFAVAEYVRRVLGGGLGPVFRYAPAETTRR